MDLDTVKYLRDLLLKDDKAAALIILNAEIEGEDEAQEAEDNEVQCECGRLKQNCAFHHDPTSGHKDT